MCVCVVDMMSFHPSQENLWVSEKPSLVHTGVLQSTPAAACIISCATGSCCRHIFYHPVASYYNIHIHDNITYFIDEPTVDEVFRFGLMTGWKILIGAAVIHGLRWSTQKIIGHYFDYLSVFSVIFQPKLPNILCDQPPRFKDVVCCILQLMDYL